MRRRNILWALFALFGGLRASADDLVINSAADWNAFVENAATYADGNITLANDISVEQPYSGTFSGTFDGKGYTVTLAFTPTDAAALFSATEAGAVIKDLKVEGTVVAENAFAGLILNLNGETTIEDVHINGDFTVKKGYIAGFVVNSKSRLNATRCSFHGKLTHDAGNSEANAAAFISRNDGAASYSFRQCESAGIYTVVTGWRAGGFVGSDFITGVAECEFIDCIYSGEIWQNNGSARLAALVGNTDKNSTGRVTYVINNCLVTGKVKRYVSNDDDTWVNNSNFLYYSSNVNTFKVSNVYHTASSDISGDKQDSKFVSADDASSGKLCYLLNGDQTTTNFRQTLGEDAAPVLDPTHAVVYQTGRKHCDGTDYDDVAYSNTSGSVQIDEHSFEGNVCSVCGELKAGEDGYVHVSSADDLLRVARSVSNGRTKTNVRMDNDIEVTAWADDEHPMIGTSANPFVGIFDGQGYTLTMNYTPARSSAIFGATGQGAVVKNLVVDGSVESDYLLSGLIFDMEGDASIENVEVKATLKTYTNQVAGFIANCKARLTVHNSQFTGHVESFLAKETNVAGFISATRATASYSFNQCESAGKIVTAGWRSGGFVCSEYMTTVAECEYIDCIYSGEIWESNESKRIGAFMGSIDNYPGTYTLRNCLVTGKLMRWNSNVDASWITNPEYMLYCTYNMACTVNIDNVYHTPSAGYEEDVKQLSVLVDEQDIASGKLCYQLNGDQSTTNFRQTLGQDETPVLDPTHAIVYLAGRKHCDGTDYEGVVYNNTGSSVTIDDHNFVDHICDFCGELLLSEDGYFHIADEFAFTAFAKAVSLKGQKKVNAKLDEDITISMGTYEECPMIGSDSNPYDGIFDGQGHTLTAYVASDGEAAGVFQNITSATIKDTNFEGTINGVGGQTGMVGAVSGGEPVFINLINKMDIRGNVNVGGFIGNGNNRDLPTKFLNCMFAGKVTYTNTKVADGIGGFVGWSYSTKYDIQNCAMIGDIDLGPGTTPAYLLRIRNTCTVNAKNCVYLKLDNVKYANGNNDEHKESSVPVGFTETESGAMCYALNGNGFEVVNWYQEIGSDEAPVLDPTHGLVYQSVDGYASAVPNAENMPNISNDLKEEALAFSDLEEHPAQRALVEAYIEAIEELASCTTLEELQAAYYPAIVNLRKQVAESQKAYAAYIAKVEETRMYVAEHEEDFKGGPLYDLLTIYLSDDAISPSEEEYPNGSFAYIIDEENLLLDAEQLEAEKAFIDAMLAAALNEGLRPGADATLFLVNADFSDKFNGWEGVTMTTAAVNAEGTQRIAESWSSAPFDMYQTITVPENGIYELSMSGAYRIQEIGDCSQYGATFYINDHHNYLQAVIEDMIPVSDAVSGENCWLGSTSDYEVTNDNGDIIGYTVHGQQGAAYAFLAGRYQNNRILVNVTDNQLTVGIRNLHEIYRGNEWAAIGNIRLTYHGELDEAGEALDNTLQSMKDRAEFILNTYEHNSDIYRTYPNFSNDLRQALQEKVNAIALAESNEQKYELVGQISDLFLQIYDCKSDYAELWNQMIAIEDAVYSMSGSELLPANVESQVEAAADYIYNAYENGLITSTEAAEGSKLAEFDFLPEVDDNDVCHLNTALDMNIYASLYQSGYKYDAAMECDILTDVTYLTIGTTAVPYVNKFDGQGHTLTVTIERPESERVGVFGLIGAATIQNLICEGTIIGARGTGLVGEASGKAKFSNIVSRLNIEGTNNVGGLMGAMYKGPHFINDYLFAGHVKATENGGGGVVGWSSNNTVYAENILSIGEVEGDQCAYLFRVKCNGTLGDPGTDGCFIEGSNLYYVKTSSDDAIVANGAPKLWGTYLNDVSVQTNADELATGKICYLLNKANTEEPLWRQTIGEDATPLLMSDSKIVRFDGTKYYNTDESAIDEILDAEPAGTLTGIYNLAGQRVQNPVRGLYIINGKKVLVK